MTTISFKTKENHEVTIKLATSKVTFGVLSRIIRSVQERIEKEVPAKAVLENQIKI